MYARSERLRELLRTEVARALRGVKDPGLSGFMTVTDLALSADLKTATVYYSILGSGRERQSSAAALERASPYIRQVLRKRLTLKLIPHLVFLYDETPRKASRIEQLLMKIEGEEEK